MVESGLGCGTGIGGDVEAKRFFFFFAQGMAQDKFGCSPGCLAIPRAAGPAECSALHLQSLGTTYPSAGRKGVVLTSSQPPGGSSTASKTAWF